MKDRRITIDICSYPTFLKGVDGCWGVRCTSKAEGIVPHKLGLDRFREYYICGYQKCLTQEDISRKWEYLGCSDLNILGDSSFIFMNS